MKKPKIYYIRWIMPPYRGITIPPFGIFIRKDHKNSKRILNHELVHWNQYQKMGLIKFYYQYFKEFIALGYDKMPMEMEARYEEDEYTKKHYSETYHR